MEGVYGGRPGQGDTSADQCGTGLGGKLVVWAGQTLRTHDRVFAILRQPTRIPSIRE